MLSLCEEVGILGEGWNTLGGPNSDWANLASLWLRAESAIGRASYRALDADNLAQGPLPEEWKAWLLKQLDLDSELAVSMVHFGVALTKYLQELNWQAITKNPDHILTYPWTHGSSTGLISLLLVLHWQAKYSGTGPEWKDNLMLTTKIFEAVLKAPSM